jgi:hypothetical protein
MSVKDQEQRQKQAERRIEGRMRAADRHVYGPMLVRQKAADLRADEVVERIERGGVDPRPLPSLREDSLASTESIPSMGSSPSMGSIEPPTSGTAETPDSGDDEREVFRG